ncbi:flagellar hook-basal body complex protein FliE [Thalassoglobus sp. JC818]|uniref:flagellar hook-basal body complex protein FliE n=1 Tax=Thalassoglobus sp. JC818 TaxID=3232136 RepID=UPI003458945D
MNISNLSQLPEVATIASHRDVQNTATSSMPFAETFQSLLSETLQQQQIMAHGHEQVLNGDAQDLQQLAIDTAKAELSFRFVLELRDRLITSYQEVMRMQV